MKQRKVIKRATKAMLEKRLVMVEGKEYIVSGMIVRAIWHRYITLGRGDAQMDVKISRITRFDVYRFGMSK